MPDSRRTSRTRIDGLALLLTLGAAVVALFAFAPVAAATIINVDTQGDEFQTAGSNCSLREAVEAANTNAPKDVCPGGQAGAFDPDTINLPPGNYLLTSPGLGGNSTGDLDITDTNLTIQATGPGQTTISSSTGDRVIEIAPSASSVAIRGIRLTGGSGSPSGGGIATTGGLLTLTGVTVDGNTSSGIGGGIFVGDPARVDIANTTISGNSSLGSGAGLATLSNGSPSFIKNSTITSNTADSDGNGDGGGGGISTAGSETVQISNTIMSGNAVKVFSSSVPEDCNGNVFSGGSNLVGTDSDCVYPGASITAGNLTGTGIGAGVIAHNTGSLADNGGTVLTRLPARSSPAINRGYPGSGAGTTCETTDARGTARPQEGRCDMGAVEVSGAPAQAYPVTTTADEFDSGFTGNCSLREAVTAANNHQATGGCPAGAGGTVTNTIQLAAGTYTLTRPGTDDLNVNGDLDVIASGTRIEGTGTAQTTIDGNGAVTGDRVIDARAGLIAGVIGFVNVRNGATTGNGGGIEINSDLYLRNVTVSGNSAGGDGGGVHYTTAGSGDVLNSTFSGNQANGNGGGIYSADGFFPTVDNATVTLNTADANGGGGGGGGLAGFAGGQIANTIVAGNTDASGGDAPDCVGIPSIPSLGYNLIGDADNCSFVAATGDQVGTSATPIPSGLGPLADNGNTTLTHAPLFGSAALNLGNPAAVGSPPACLGGDQRNVTRPLGGRCDVGAVEIIPVSRLLTVAKGGTGSGTVTGSGISCGADCTETVGDAAVVILSAVPATGSTFAGWSGCDSASGATCTQTLGANDTVTATFNLIPVVTPPGNTNPGSTPVVPPKCKKKKAKKKKAKKGAVASKCKKKKKKKKKK